MFGRVLFGTVAVVAWMGGGVLAVSAEPFDGKTARSLLIQSKKSAIEVIPNAVLDEKDLRVIREISLPQNYYGAVAMSPGDGLLHKATLAATGYHDTDSASKTALAACNSAREAKPKCIIVALIRPEDWASRALQLSFDASNGFSKTYRRAKAPKAFATSIQTGEWALSKGENASETALAKCNALAAVKGARDCSVVIAD